ncbi:hypothetical protein BH11PSE12_BH11PSE12_20340 [soil metagenome]
MNHQYRIVWSQIANTWVAISEISEGHSKTASTRKRLIPALASAGLSFISMTSSAFDLPTGAQVTAGAATVQTPAKGAMLINQSTQRAVIQWNGFSIGQGKQVTFAQPNSSAATLNVVTGSSASAIAGTLNANGSVYLINQNGIAITPSGLIDTRAGFIASTLRMDENAFMNGKNLFSGKGGAILNQGQIVTGQGGVVGLLGSTVVNEGLISASLGKVALGSGEVATLDLSGDGFLQVMLPTSAVAADGRALVTNSGVIHADGGTVMLKAATVRQALREAVNIPGAISSRSVSGKNGAIVLEAGEGGTVRVSGSLTADGNAMGGRIDVTGATVVLEGASLSATGTERGGLVRVGGGFQGGREQPADSANAALFAGRFGSTPAITNAKTTTIDATSSINVSATGATGTGGSAIVWSDSTTVMQGAISARGALAGGAVEVSAKSTVQSVALKRIDLGKGGNLLIDPQDIVIDNVAPGDAAGSYSYAPSGTSTHLLDADVTALLSAGTTVSLQASQDISWLDNFTFVTRTPTTPGGNLNLSAGRSVALSGSFTTADGNWNIVANDTKAHGVVDAERGTGAAEINVQGANFINSNGNFSLTLADGAGNTNRAAGGISLGKFNGNGLTAVVSSTAMPASGATRILLTDNINVSGSINLTGNLQVSSMSPVLSLSGSSVIWSDEKSGATLRGEGGIKFVENGIATRLGKLSFSDAVRLELGGDSVTRTYGDADPAIADLLTPQLHVATHSPAVAPDSLMAILSADSLAVSGPGRYAAAGQNTLAVTDTGNAAFAGGLQGGYFVDLTAATTPLTIAQRSVTPTVSNGAYTYGSPSKVVTLGNVVNGDQVLPVTTLNGSPHVGMAVNGTGFGFVETLAAGNSAYTLSGLAGSQASNYFLDLSGPVTGRLDIARKPLNYVAQGGSHIYGSPNGLPLGALSGIVAHDDVTPQVGLSGAGVPTALATKLAVGTYTASVLSLGGAKAGNYTIAASGNTDGQYQVTPKTLTYAVANASSTYGTLASLGSSVLTGILAGDAVTAVASIKDAADNTVSQSPTLAAGNYREIVSALSGVAGSNYQLASSGNQDGTLAIARKQITYTGSDSTQTYGTGALPTPALNGIVGTDRVIAQQSVATVQSQQQGGSGAVPVGEYKVYVGSLSGAESANYSVVQPGSTPGHALVTPKALSYTLAPSSQIIYGDAAPNALFNGIVNGDLIQGMSNVSSTAGAQPLGQTTDVGSYTRSIVSLSGTGVGNYALASSGNINGNLTITPRSLTWQVVRGGSAVYGDTITNYASLNLVPGDTVDAIKSALDSSGAAIERPGVGSYAVGVTSISGPRAANYVLATNGNTTGSVQITPRQVDYGYNTTYSVYGSEQNAYAANSVQLYGVLQSDKNQVHALAYPMSFLLDANGIGRALDKRLAAGLYSRAGAYVTGLDNPNYILGTERLDPGAAPRGSHYISQKPLYTSTTATMSMTYGDTYNPMFASLSGIVPGDEVGNNVYATLNGNISNGLLSTGEYAVTASNLKGYSAPNYYLVQQAVPLMLTVKPKPVYLLYSQVGNSPKYFGSPIANTVEYGTLLDPAGLIDNQTPVTVFGLVSGGEAGYLTQPKAPGFERSGSGAINAGTYTWAPASFYSTNYTVMNSGAGAKYLTITPKPVTANLSTWSALATLEYGNTEGVNPYVNVAWVGNTVRTGDDIGVKTYVAGLPAGQDSLSARQNVGFYPIYANGVTGRDAANYRVDYTPSSYGLGVTIVPRSVSATINSTQFTYGNSITVPKPVLNILPGDSVTATAVVTNGKEVISNFENYDRWDAGTYYLKLGPLSGASASNYKIGGQQDANARRFNRPLDELAFLSIEQRQLKLAGTYQNFGITYGDSITPSLYVTGVLPGDDVDTRPKAQLSGSSNLIDINGLKPALGERLAAGEYSLKFPLTGMSSKNYRAPVYNNGFPIFDFGNISVAKRATSLQDVAAEYGTANWTPSFTNVLAGDDLRSTALEIFNDKLKRTEPIPAGLIDAGGYAVIIKTIYSNTGAVLSGPGSSNYYVVNGGMSYFLSVAPKMLTWTPNSNLSTTYGEAVALGKLSGFLNNDIEFTNRQSAADNYRSLIQVNAKFEDASAVNEINKKYLGNGLYSTELAYPAGGYSAIMNSKLTYGSVSGLEVTYSGYARRADAHKTDPVTRRQTPLTPNVVDQALDRPVNAGIQNIFTSGSQPKLSGERAGNYQLPANMQVSVEVKPRLVNFSIDNSTRQYGNYEGCNFKSCPVDVPAQKLGSVHYNNLLPLDNLGDGILKNAVEHISLISATGDKLTVGDITAQTPVGTYYYQVLDSLESKNYAVAQSGNQSGLLQITPKWLKYTTTSAFYLPGVGLVGQPGKATLHGVINGDKVTAVVVPEDPQRNVIDDFNSVTLVAGRYIFPVRGLVGENAGNYRVVPAEESDKYLYQYFQQPIPYWGYNQLGTLDVFADTSLGMKFIPPVSLPPLKAAPPREDIVTIVASLPALPRVGVSINEGAPAADSGQGSSSPGVKISTGTGTTTTTTTSLAGATFDANAKANTSASCGVTGCASSAQATAETSVALSAADKLKAEAEASAKVTAGLQGFGVGVSAKTSAQIAVEVAGSHGVGGGSNIDYNAIVGATAGAGAGAKAGTDGITTGFEAGAGFSVGGSTGISNQAGSASAGASFSTGMVGGNFSIKPGYSDGVLSVSTNLGAALGFGGLSLNVNLSVNLSPVIDGVSNILHSYKPSDAELAQQAFKQAEGLSSDPAAQIRFLTENRDWERYPNGDHSKFEKILAKYYSMMKAVEVQKNYELKVQANFMKLLATDKYAALDYLKSSEVIQKNDVAYKALIKKAQDLNIQFAFQNNSFDFVSVNRQ